MLWGLVASVGLGTLLAASHVAYGIVRTAGACYLIFLGVKMLLRKHPLVSASGDVGSAPVPANHVSAGGPRWFVRGLLTNLLNPKVGVFYVTFLPQFIPAGGSVTSFSVLLAAIHASEGILWFSLLTLAMRPLARWLSRASVAQSLDRAMGTLLVGFGIGLLLDSRR